MTGKERRKMSSKEVNEKAEDTAADVAVPFPFPLGKKPSAADDEAESDARPLNERVGRHLIYCDAPNCDASNPPLVCPDCDAAYFCNEECRSDDADDDHGHTCYSDRVLKNKYEHGQFNLFATDAETLRSAKTHECAICLTDQLVEPTVLTQCKHQFCGPCLLKWNKTSSSCPTCRLEMLTDDEHEETLIGILSSREMTCKSAKERGEIRSAVRKRIDGAMDGKSHGRTVPLLLSLARHVAKEGKVDETKRIIAEIREKEGVAQYAHNSPACLRVLLDAKVEELEAQGLGEEEVNDAIRSDPVRMALRMFPMLNLTLGEAHRCHEDYDSAINCFEWVLEVDNNCGTNHAIQWQLAECYFHTGRFRKSIEASQKALRMGNRHRGVVHKARALSHLAMGESFAAVQGLEQGILSALDNGDRAELYEIYREFTSRQPPFDPRQDIPAPRFKVGDVVDCRVAGDTWRRGVVNQVWWRNDDADEWPKYFWTPYQMKLDGVEGNSAFIYSPVDSDEAIRKAPRFQVGQKVDACVEDGWEEGVIIKLWPSQRETSGMFGWDVICPYIISLHDGSIAYAPMDDDKSVRINDN